MAADELTYQEISASIASILTKHPQFEPIFHKFERFAWVPIPRGLIKRNPEIGASMIAERNKTTGKVDIIFSVLSTEPER